jgi:pimeloyl-ACP methyl ester carboxylesterase
MAMPAENPENAPRLVTVGGATRQLAVRLHGSLGNRRRLPLICLPGLIRNSEDFEALIPRLADIAGPDWPVLRIDLIGRGASTPELRRQTYSTAQDAEDALSAVRSFGISRAVWLGQNHGGQVIQMIAVSAPEAIGGAILCDSGPVIDVRGLVRLRNNLDYLASVRGEAAFLDASRQINQVAYPMLSAAALDRLALRTHAIGRRGRIEPKFDRRIVRALDKFENTDLLSPQWQIFDALTHAPLMLLRSELSDLLRVDVFDKMTQRRRDALRVIVPNEGSPALFEGPAETGTLAGFLTLVSEEDARRRL